MSGRTDSTSHTRRPRDLRICLAQVTYGGTCEDHSADLRVHRTAMPGRHNGRHMTAMRRENAGSKAAISRKSEREESSTGITAATRRRITRRSAAKPRMANAAERQASAGAR